MRTSVHTTLFCVDKIRLMQFVRLVLLCSNGAPATLVAHAASGPSKYKTECRVGDAIPKVTVHGIVSAA